MQISGRAVGLAVRVRRFGLVLVLLLVFHPVSWAAGPSFSCSHAATPDEHAICASEELSSLEMSMTWTYRRLRAELGIEAVVEIGRSGVRQRRSCGKNVKCLKASLIAQTAALQALTSPAYSLQLSANEQFFCDFTSIQRAECNNAAVRELDRYYRYEKKAFEQSTGHQIDDGLFGVNRDLCKSNAVCLWYTYLRFITELGYRDTDLKASLAPLPQKLATVPDQGGSLFACDSLFNAQTHRFRIRLRRWLDEYKNHILAIDDYGRWNTILVDSDPSVKLVYDENIANWWQILLTEKKPFIDGIWDDSRRDTWIVIRYAPGRGTLETLYAFGDIRGNCYTFPDSFEPLKNLDMLPDEALNYFYDTLVARPVKIPPGMASSYPELDIALEKKNRLELFLKADVARKQREVSEHAKATSKQGNANVSQADRAKTMVPGKVATGN